MTQQPQDLLTRFTNRSRHQVERGEDDVTSAIKQLESEPIREPSLVEPTSVSSPTQKLEKQVESFPEIEGMTIRVEASIKEAVQEYARRNKVTPECLLQGLWKVAQTNPAFLKQATELASEDRNLRQRMGAQKRTLTQMKQLMDD